MRSPTQPSSLVLALLATIVNPASAERVLGAYIFARHGDRTPKVLGNTELTNLGYSQVHQTGVYYHNRYIEADSQLHIEGMNDGVVKLSQISVSAPSDDVLQNSATAFLQGVYPPVGSSAKETLANETTIQAPLDGYQLIPLSLITTGTDSEDNTWLQDATGCQNAKISSNNYYTSSLYEKLHDSTKSFYESLSDKLTGAFSTDEISFKNAYAIFDYLNVASIHNTSNTATRADLRQLSQLANIEQYNLAYNSSDTVRAIAGSQLAGEMLEALTKTVTEKGAKTKLNIQFGSYGTFLSYFGLAQLPKASPDFTGIPDYASSMAWELVTDAKGDSFPSASDISVRFVFHNGTISGDASPSEYALYGQSSATIPWEEFVDQTKKIAVMSDKEWCEQCGGQCDKSAGADGGDSAGTSSTDGGAQDGVTRTVAGVIGAMVTLAVILGLEALFLLVGGYRITKKTAAVVETVETKA